MQRAAAAIRESVVSLLRGTSMPFADIATQCGVSKTYVYKLAHMEGIGARHIVTDETRKRVVEMVRRGASHPEIRKACGVSKKYIQKVAADNGLRMHGRKEAEQHRDDAIAKAVEMAAANGFTYIGGYAGYEGDVMLKCNECGATVTMTYAYISRERNVGLVRCPACVEKERERLREQRAAHEQEQKRKAEAERQAKREEEKRRAAERAAERAEQARMAKLHPCAVCGKLTDRRKYCSKKCYSVVENKRREIHRRAKVSAALVDDDITLERVFQNDMGICYLCHMPCRFDDIVERDGTLIAGNAYPSIDHVIPLAKGGKHSWANVRLACRLCNSRKRDNIPPPPPAK